MSPIKTERQECIVYSRVVGWLTPVKNWNKGKKSEYGDRKTYDVRDCDCGIV
jgi:ribonucleoside-triphosphate reductase